MGVADEVLNKFSQDFNTRMANTPKRSVPISNAQIKKAVTPKAQQSAGLQAKRLKSGSGGQGKKKAAVKKPEFIADKNVQAEELKSKLNDRSIGGDILHAVGSVADVAARSFYAMAEAARQIPANINDGEPIWSLGDDIVSGAVSGLWGTKKTSYGDVLDEVEVNQTSDNPDKFLSFLFSNVPGYDPKSTMNRRVATEETPVVRTEDGYLDKTLVEDMWKDSSGRTGLDRAVRRATSGPIAGDKGAGKFMPGAADVILDPVNALSIGRVNSGIKTLAEDGGKRLLGEAAQQYTKETAHKLIRSAIDDVNPEYFKKKGAVVRGPGGKFTPGAMVPDDVKAAEFTDQVSQWIEEATQEIQAGNMAGKAIRGPEMARTITNRVSFKYRESVLEGMSKDLEKAKGWITNTITPGKNDITKFKGKSKYHAAYMDELNKARDAWNAAHTVKGTTTPDWTKFTPAVKEALHNKAYKAVVKMVDDETTKIYAAVSPTLSQLPTKAITVRVFGDNKITLQKTADFTDWVGKKVGDTGVGKALKTAFSYTEHFPGYTSLMSQKAKSQGIAGYEAFAEPVIQAAKAFSRKDRQIISEALHSGRTLDTRLQAGVDMIRGLQDEIWMDEIDNGMRQGAKAIKADNYGYLWLNGGTETQRRNFMELRQAEIQAGGPITHNYEKAIQMGLKPEKDAFKALLLRKMKSQRKFMKTWFITDLVNHYGVAVTDFKNMPARVAMELKVVKSDMLLQSTQQSLRPGQKFVLPQHIYDVFDKYQNMAKLDNTQDTRQLLKIYDWLTRKFKTSATVYYPSYHIRNMFGDVYMGVLDGVKMADYHKMFPVGGPSKLKVGDVLINRDEIVAMFKETASSGSFMNAEVGISSGMLRGPGKLAQKKVREWSEARENFARLVHFYRALDDEATAFAKKGLSVQDPKILEMAKDAATARVNLHKFDYSALTPFETKYMRRIVPFYTYARKAMPLLAESILTNPKMFSHQSRLFDRAGEDGGLDSLRMPSYLREIGVIPLDGAGNIEPTVIRKDILPTNIFSQYFNPGTRVDQSAAGGLATNLLGQINPILQTPFELKEGKSSFSGKKGTALELIARHWRPYGTVEQIRSVENGEKWFSIATGIPVTKITTGMQESAFKSHEDFVQASVNNINGGLRPMGYNLYYVKRIPEGGSELDGTMEYRIARITTDKKNIPWLTGFSTMEEAGKAFHAKVKGAPQWGQ